MTVIMFRMLSFAMTVSMVSVFMLAWVVSTVKIQTDYIFALTVLDVVTASAAQVSEIRSIAF